MSTQHVQYVLPFFSTGSEFRPVSNFMELHTLTLAIRSYVLLPDDSPPIKCLQALKEIFNGGKTKLIHCS